MTVATISATPQMSQVIQVQDAQLTNSAEERNLLAVCYSSQSAWLEVNDFVTEDFFTHSVNRALWTLIDQMRSSDITPSAVLVYERLPQEVRQQLDDLGGWSYLEALGNLPISESNAIHHANNLRNLTVLRRGNEAGQRISQEALAATDKDTYLARVEEIVNEIPGPIGDEITLLGSTAEDYVLDRIAHPKEIPGLSTGWPIVDEAIQGLQPGRMYVLGARKKSGKSVCLLNMVKHLAVDNNIPVLYISTEQTQKDEVSRLLSIVSRVPERYVSNGIFTTMGTYPEQVEEAVEKIKKAPIYFAHDPFFTLNKLRRTIKKHRILNGIQCVFFDYIKIPAESMGSKDKWSVVGDLAYGLKACASEQNIPVVTAVQINRDGAEAMKFTGDIDSDSFANSDMIAQAMSVGFVLRGLNPEEKKEHTFAGEKRILKITDNRHGASNMKLLMNFEDEIVTLVQNKLIS